MTEYAWVRVGDGDPEPAAITGTRPNRLATTIGCPDPFKVDDPESGCAIVLLIDGNYREREHHKIGQSIEDDKRGRAEEAFLELFDECGAVEVSRDEAARREAAYQKAIKAKPHNYAGFGRRNRA